MESAIKTITLILACVLILSTLAACDLGNKTSASSNEATEPVPEGNSEVITEQEETNTSEVTTESIITTSTPEETTVAHIHSYSAEWKFNSIQHWHECECGEKSSIDEHSYGEWAVVKAPTDYSEGEEKRICSQCVYGETRQIAKLEHIPTVWSGNYAQFPGSGTAEDPYIIASGEHLKWLQMQVNAGNSYEGKLFIQVFDIDLGNKDWQPIGKDLGITTASFSGVYDGLGHSISMGNSYNPLFKYIHSTRDAESGVMNLKIYGGRLAEIVGGASSDRKRAFLINITANCQNMYTGGSSYYYGGIVNYCIGTDLTNVIFNGSMIIEYDTRSISAGGIVGDCFNSSFFRCINNGNITISNGHSRSSITIGGIAGRVKTLNQETEKTLFDGCVNNGALGFEDPTILIWGCDGECYVGGIIGYAQTSSSTVTLHINNCLNTGNVFSASQRDAYAGGIIAKCEARNCVVEGSINTSRDLVCIIFDINDHYVGKIIPNRIGGIIASIQKNNEIIDGQSVVIKTCATISSSIIGEPDSLQLEKCEININPDLMKSRVETITSAISIVDNPSINSFKSSFVAQ